MNDKNFSDKLEAFGTLGANVPTKTDAAVLPSISPQERELAQAGLIEYVKGNHAECLESFAKLEPLRPKDLKLHLNKAVVLFCKSELKDSDTFIQSLNNVANQVKEDEQDISCFIQYNLALGLFYTGKLNAALKHLLKAFQCIESLDEGLSQRVCILLIEVFLGLSQAQKALALLSYTENQLLSTAFDQATSDKSPVITPGIIKHKKEPTTKVPAEPTITPLPPAFEANWLKAKLATLRARASLQARLWRTNKKDVKALQAVTMQSFIASALMARAYLDFLRGQFNKAARTLNTFTPPDTLKSGNNVSLTWFNNLACCHFMGGRNLLAIRYLTRAIAEADTYSCQGVNNHTRIANAQLAMNIGLVLLHANQPEDAFSYLLMAVRSFPSNPRLWLRLAECCIEAHGNDNILAYDFMNNGRDVVQKSITCVVGSKIVLLNYPERKRPEKLTGNGPNVSLEYATLCLKNALVLLSANNSTNKNSDRPDSPSSGQNQTVSSVSNLVDTLSAPSLLPQCLPSIPLTEVEADGLLVSVLAASAYTSLCLGEPTIAVEYARKMLSLPNLTEGMKFLAQLYAAEGLICLDQISEAIDLLQPDTVLADLDWELPEVTEQDKDQLSPEKRPKARFEPVSQQTAKATMLYNLAVAYAIRGNLDKATEAISLVHQCKSNDGKAPVQLVMLSVYVELQQGHVENALNILNQHGTLQTTQY